MNIFPIRHKPGAAGLGILVSIWLLPVLAQGAEPANNGRNIMHQCQVALDYLDHDGSASDMEAVKFCDDYLTGFREEENVKDLVMGEKHVRGYCFPPRGITNGKLARVIVTYLETYEQEQRLDANTAIRNALAEGYPCN
jgi:hypothetical protein